MSKIDFLRGPHVRIRYSADEWRLYNADTPEQEQDRDYVSDVLNQSLEQAIAEAPTRHQFRLPMEFNGYSSWGTDRNNVRLVLHEILEKVYT